MKKLRKVFIISSVGIAVAIVQILTVQAQSKSETAIAERFAPIFFQALGDNPRSDYITNFNFDGDWRGDNNWANAENKKFPLLAYVYYAVSETSTHYFIHYAVFHPRDYKGGEQRGLFLSDLIRQGAKIVGENDPTGLMDETAVAHENDMEGTLVVVAKNGKDPSAARVEFVETLRHNVFVPYVAGESRNPRFTTVKSFGDRVLLYIEPKGHGIEAYLGDIKQTLGKQFLIYKYYGIADNPERRTSDTIGYRLLPIETTLWPKAQIGLRAKGKTFGVAHDYSQISVSIQLANGRAVKRKVKLGGLGSAFLGKVGGINMARPPWGWFDTNRRDDPLGLWFFDPAGVTKRNFDLGESFSTVYIRLPFWALK